MAESLYGMPLTSRSRQLIAAAKRTRAVIIGAVDGVRVDALVARARRR